MGYTLGTPVLNLISGADVSSYRSALLLLVAGGSLYAGETLLYYVLVIFRRQKSLFVLYGIVFLAALAVTGPLVRTHGIMGGAAAYFLMMALLFLLFGRKIKKDTDMKIKSMVLLGLIAAGLLADIVISSVVTYYVTDHFIGAVIAYITNMLCCVLLLGCQFNQLSTNVIQGELDFVRRLWQQEKEQYEVSRDNIDLINIKCHDMRHKIRSITENALSAEEIAEIENSISIYDSAVKTGNAALDVILTEKSLRCHGNDISFTCVADGSLLNFMSESDIYSLFGNVMDNAIEATVKIPERDGRTIGLKIKQIGNFVSVNVKNTFDGNLELDKRGLPVTTKSDKNYHGFGIKSVSYLVEKYGGNLSVAADDGVFDLNLLFPIEQADKTE